MVDSRRMRRAFTLIEILVVVMILGLLAAIVVPQFGDASTEARRTAFINSGRIFVSAAKLYHLDLGVHPHARSGVLPVGFGDYIQSQNWERATPIGGEWKARSPGGGPSAVKKELAS